MKRWWIFKNGMSNRLTRISIYRVTWLSYCIWRHTTLFVTAMLHVPSFHIRWHIFCRLLFSFQANAWKLVIMDSKYTTYVSFLRTFLVTQYPDLTVYWPLLLKVQQKLSRCVVLFMAKLKLNGISSRDKIVKHLHMPFLWVFIDKFTDRHSRMGNQTIRAFGWAGLAGVVGIQGSSHALTSYPEWIFCLNPNNISCLSAEILVHTYEGLSVVLRRKGKLSIIFSVKKPKIADSIDIVLFVIIVLPATLWWIHGWFAIQYHPPP